MIHYLQIAGVASLLGLGFGALRLFISLPFKLVRDRIPEDIERTNGYCLVTQLKGADYRKALAAKLVEEAKEIAAARTREKITGEMADLMSVFESYRIACGVTSQDLHSARQIKDMKYGVFCKGFKIVFLFRPLLTRKPKR